MISNTDNSKNWFLSSQGHKLYPLDLSPEDINIEDIAHSLSNLCRFNGHCKQFYSVAQHSVLVSQGVLSHNKLTALLHDATEAYCGDMIRPIKTLPEMNYYREIESGIWAVIAYKYNIPIDLPEEVDIYDARVLLAEKRDLMVTNGHVWEFPQCKYPDLDPYPIDPIECWSPSKAKAEFLSMYQWLEG
jgi:uncharacterized protein